MVIPSQAEIFGRCRDLTADSSREEKVQTTNPKTLGLGNSEFGFIKIPAPKSEIRNRKGVAKAIAGKHNPLVIGSNPIEGIK